MTDLAAAPVRTPRTVGEVEGFVSMLLAACESRQVNDQLEKLLAMPDEKRRATVHAWVNDLLIARAPPDFTQAIACLMDDRVAEKAYQVIYECQRPGESVMRQLAPIFRDLTPTLPVAAVVAIGARLARTFRALASMLPVAFIVAIGVWALWPPPPFKPLVEMAPAQSFRVRTPAIKAYEDIWWAGVLKNLGALCSGLAKAPRTAQYFVVFVGADGGIIRIDIRPPSDTNARLDEALRSIVLPPFTPEQSAEKKTLGLRGYFNAQEEKCYVQRT